MCCIEEVHDCKSCPTATTFLPHKVIYHLTVRISMGKLELKERITLLFLTPVGPIILNGSIGYVMRYVALAVQQDHLRNDYITLLGI